MLYVAPLAKTGVTSSIGFFFLFSAVPKPTPPVWADNDSAIIYSLAPPQVILSKEYNDLEYVESESFNWVLAASYSSLTISNSSKVMVPIAFFDSASIKSAFSFLV